jgi:hypothetical protein
MWIAILLVGFGGMAHAGGDKAKARQLFSSGQQHYNLGEYADALADFKEAPSATESSSRSARRRLPASPAR